MDATIITELTEAQCWELLTADSFGRLATAAAGEVEIFPVNYVVDPGVGGVASLVFRTAPGSKLVELTVSPRVAFEIDSIDGDVAHSVVVQGHAVRIDRQQEIDAADALPLRPVVPTLKYDFVRILPDVVTGRRFHLGPEPDRSMV